MLQLSSTNYILDWRARGFRMIWPMWNTILYNILPQLSCRFTKSTLNPYRVIVLTRSSGTSYVPNKHTDLGQYGSIPSMLPYYIYSSSVKKHHSTSSSGTHPWWSKLRTIWPICNTIRDNVMLQQLFCANHISWAKVDLLSIEPSGTLVSEIFKSEW